MLGAPVGVFEEAALEAFDLAFSVNGTLVRRSLGASWDMPFEAMDPVREFSWHKDSHGFAGWYYSSTMRDHVGYESWLERDRLILLDRDPHVVAIASQPFWLHWHDGTRRRRHAPTSSGCPTAAPASLTATNGTPCSGHARTTVRTSSVLLARTTATARPTGAHTAWSWERPATMSGSVTTRPAGSRRLSTSAIPTAGGVVLTKSRSATRTPPEKLTQIRMQHRWHHAAGQPVHGRYARKTDGSLGAPLAPFRSSLWVARFPARPARARNAYRSGAASGARHSGRRHWPGAPPPSAAVRQSRGVHAYWARQVLR